MLDPKLVQITIHEGENIISALYADAAALCEAVEADVTARRMLKEAETDLTAIEAGIVAEANIAAQAKEGPLAGIATTSKAYTAAVEVLLGQSARRHNVRMIVARLQTDADNAAIAREQASIRFSATKHAAELKAAIIRAIVL